jgi:GT2 family glycosyltransferase
MQGNTLCIVLVNYRNDEDTVACVKSIHDSGYSPKPEIVVVENSGGPSNIESVLSYYPGIKILNPGKNLGFAEGNNYGIRYAAHSLVFDFLLILNNDTLLKKDTLSNLVSFAKLHPELLFTAPVIVTMDSPSRIWFGGGGFLFSRMTAIINHIGEKFADCPIPEQYTDFASGCALLVSSRFEKLEDGIFDPFFFMYDEDLDLSLTIKEKWGAIGLVSNSVVEHKCQGSQANENTTKINQLAPGSKNLIFYLKNTVKNRYYIIEKHFNGSRRFLLKSSVTIYWIAKSMQFFINCRFDAGFLVLSETFKSIFSIQKINTSNLTK